MRALDSHRARDHQALLRRVIYCQIWTPTNALFCIRQVESFEHQGKLGGLDLDVCRALGGLADEMESTPGELLGHDAVPGAVPEENADLVTAPISKDE